MHDAQQRQYVLVICVLVSTCYDTRVPDTKSAIFRELGEYAFFAPKKHIRHIYHSNYFSDSGWKNASVWDLGCRVWRLSDMETRDVPLEVHSRAHSCSWACPFPCRTKDFCST